MRVEKRIGLIAIALLSGSASAWEVVPVKGGFDAGYALYDKSTQPIKTWLRPSRPELSVHCDSRGQRVWLNVGAPLSYSGEFRYGRVKYRIDGGRIVSELWSEATTSGVYGSPSSNSLIAKLSKAAKFELEVTPHNAGPATVEFDLSGFSTAYAELKKQCAKK